MKIIFHDNNIHFRDVDDDGENWVIPADYDGVEVEDTILIIARKIAEKRSRKKSGCTCSAYQIENYGCKCGAT